MGSSPKSVYIALYRHGTVILRKPENTEQAELRFCAVLEGGAADVRFERTTLS